MYLIIHKLHGFPEIRCLVLPRNYVFKQLLQNNTLHAELCSLMFYSLSIVLFLYNYSSKASGLLFILVHVSTSHAHFPNNEIRIPWMPMRSSMLFFGCKMSEKSTKKAGLEVCGRSLRPVTYLLGKKHTFEADLTCV